MRTPLAIEITLVHEMGLQIGQRGLPDIKITVRPHHQLEEFLPDTRKDVMAVYHSHSKLTFPLNVMYPTATGDNSR